MLGQRQDAEDAAQETFVRVLKNLPRWDATRDFLPWLLAIAGNRCRTALSKRGRQAGLSEAAEESVDPRSGLADPDDLATELVLAIGRLRHEYKMVFTLYHEQNLPYEEIAQALGRPVGTVKTWLHRARAELAEHLSRRGVRC